MSALRHVIVVGAGPGGLAAAARLRERGGDAVRVTLIAPELRATFHAGTLDVALEKAEPDQFMTRVSLDGVNLIDAEVATVEPDGVTIVGVGAEAGERRDAAGRPAADERPAAAGRGTVGERLDADAVIAAPGLRLATEVVPTWSRAAVTWDPAGTRRVRDRVLRVESGRVLVAACGMPYRCPPAPLALAVGLAGLHFGARHMTRVTVATPEPIPLAGVGGDAPALVMDACTAAGVELEREFAVDLEASSDGVLRATDGREVPYDGAFLIPPHRRPACLANLPGEGPVVPVGERGSVDGTLLYVVGDAAATGLPRAGGVARSTARAAADGALEALDVVAAPPPEPIEASCFMFHHGGALSRVRVRYTDEESSVEIDGPSLDLWPARDGELRRFLEAAGG